MLITLVGSGNMPVNEDHPLFSADPGACQLFVDNLSTTQLAALHSVVVHKLRTAERAKNVRNWERWNAIEDLLLDALSSRQLDIWTIETLREREPVSADPAVSAADECAGADGQGRSAIGR